MSRRIAYTVPLREMFLQLGLGLAVFLVTIAFLLWKFHAGSISYWCTRVIIANCLLNSAIILYFPVRRLIQAKVAEAK
jgi:hypothetical protein